MRPRFARTIALFCGLTCLGLSGTGKVRKMQRLQTGIWGGDQIALEVGPGSASVNYACAHGTIIGPLTLDRNGKFSLRGTHVRERPGPVRVDKPLVEMPARYTGWSDGKKMSLTVTLAETNEVIGTFLLERGHYTRLVKCK